MKPLLGTDVGGVLKEHKRFKGDIRWVPCSKWALRKLTQTYKMHIISHVRPENEATLRKVLKKSFVRDYIPEHRWHFVYTRADKLKVMKAYSIPILIDDRPDIIQWVGEAGMEGILFRSTDYPNWWSVVNHLRH